MLTVSSLRSQWLCGSFVFYAKRCGGGTEVSVKITCYKKRKGIVGKGRLRPKREEEEEGRKEGRVERVIMVGCITT